MLVEKEASCGSRGTGRKRTRKRGKKKKTEREKKRNQRQRKKAKIRKRERERIYVYAHGNAQTSHQLKRTRFDGVAENNGRIGVQFRERKGEREIRGGRAREKEGRKEGKRAGQRVTEIENERGHTEGLYVAWRTTEHDDLLCGGVETGARGSQRERRFGVGGCT